MRRITLLLALTFCAFSAEKRPISEKDLFAFKWIADPRIWPDGSQIAYTLVTVTAKHDNYATSLWVIPATGGAPMAAAGRSMNQKVAWVEKGCLGQ